MSSLAAFSNAERVSGDRDCLSRPSEDPDGLPLGLVPDVLGEALTCPIADFDPRQRIAKSVIAAHELIETEFPAGRLVDEHVQVGIGAGLLAGIGAEQVQRRHPVAAQGGLDRLQLGNDLGARRGTSLIENAAERQHRIAISEGELAERGEAVGCLRDPADSASLYSRLRRWNGRGASKLAMPLHRFG
jgi:hypothetical protein